MSSTHALVCVVCFCAYKLIPMVSSSSPPVHRSCGITTQDKKKRDKENASDEGEGKGNVE